MFTLSAHKSLRSLFRNGTVRPFAEKFLRAQGGNTVIIFALSLSVLMTLVGGAVDFSRVQAAKQQLQDSADTAVLRALQLVKEPEKTRKAAADSAFHLNLSDPNIEDAAGHLVSTSNGTLRDESYTATARVTSIFGAFIGMDYFDIDVVAKGQTNTAKTEIALVLDSTGSMADSNKMVNLKSSVDAVLASLLNSGGKNVTETKVAVVPFINQVRVPKGKYSWVDYSLIGGKTWDGCIVDRSQPFDVNATAPSTGSTLYPAQYCDQSSTLREVQGLTTDIAATRDFVKTLTPGGYTNITIGVQWGMEVLSPSEPFGGGAAFGASDTQKYMIVVTDGDNTRNRWSFNTSVINARTAKACAEAKAKGITVFTVRVMEGDSALLRNCASKPEYFYDLKSSAQLNAALVAVFDTIRRTRLTQ